MFTAEDSNLTGAIIKCAIEVHKVLGCGLKEAAYEAALLWELRQAGINAERQVACPVVYKGMNLSSVCEQPKRMDLLVEGRVVVECKALPDNQYVHKAQCLTYLKMLGLRTGLVLNFGLPTLKAGIQHVINESKEEYLRRLARQDPQAFRAVVEEEDGLSPLEAQHRLQETLARRGGRLDSRESKDVLRVSRVSQSSVLAPPGVRQV